MTDEKVITLSADRELLGLLVIAAKLLNISVREVLSYELLTVPFSMLSIYAIPTLS